MSSFQSELGAQFGTSLEAPPVINVDSQLWVGVIHSDPGNYPLNASYKTSDSHDFQDALGKTLEEICKVVPGGCLVFFPSYKLMEKLPSRWSQTGQWSRLNAQQPVFVEPRGQDEFEQVLNGYYASICQNNKPMIGRKWGEKVDANNCNTTKSKGNSRKGATFFAVCRGKVSEGIDFSDENARAFILVGIPFSNVFDIQVAEKKRYNDRFKSSKGLLSGNEWYCQQAFRALNQAAVTTGKYDCSSPKTESELETPNRCSSPSLSPKDFDTQRNDGSAAIGMSFPANDHVPFNVMERSSTN